MCRYEFDVPGEVVQCLACHPSQSDVACGFRNGKVRVFHVPTTSLIQEHQLHQGGVCEVCRSGLAATCLPEDNVCGSLFHSTFWFIRTVAHTGHDCATTRHNI